MSKNGSIVYVAVGSNLSTKAGTPIDTLIHSLGLFAGESLRITGQSNWYETDAFPANSGPDYVNAVIRVESALQPAQVLATLHRIEAANDRTRDARWDSRTCDLDLLAVDGKILPDLAGFQHWCDLPLSQQHVLAPDQLILPHPRLQDRAFVLVPFNEIAPEWRHPALGETVAEMLAKLPDASIQSVRRISSH